MVASPSRFHAEIHEKLSKIKKRRRAQRAGRAATAPPRAPHAPVGVRAETATAMARRHGPALAALAVALSVAAYVNALHNPFVYDDRGTVVQNPSLTDLGNLHWILIYSPFRPLVNLSYALDHRFWGLDPFGYHLTSVALHVLNVGLFFGLAAALARDPTAWGPSPGPSPGQAAGHQAAGRQPEGGPSPPPPALAAAARFA